MPALAPRRRRSGLIWIKQSSAAANQIRRHAPENDATMETIRWIVATAPEIFLLLAVAIGTMLGRTPIRGFSIGTTASILIVSVLIGQLGQFTFAPILRTVLFSLFIFTIGYRSGPEFFASLSVR